MLRSLALGFLLSLTGPHPEALTERLIARGQQDRAYDACMVKGDDDDWKCEEIYERWPANRTAERRGQG